MYGHTEPRHRGCKQRRDMTKTSKGIKMLRLYCERVELQSEKYVPAMQDGSPEEIEKNTGRRLYTCTTCEKAMECCILLEKNIEKICQSFERDEKTEKASRPNKCSTTTNANVLD